MKNRSHWSSSFSFFLVAVGSAVGLGNIWKFPYIAGENGGGAFVLIYLLFIALIGLPIFIAELYLGRQAQSNIVHAFNVIEKKKSNWRVIGHMGIISAFVILSFYSVVGGWIIDYFLKALTFSFEAQSTENINSMLNNLFASPVKQISYHFIFMLLTFLIVLGGISKGIERWSKILMPAFFVLLLGLFFYSATTEGFSKSLSFLFSPNFTKLTASGILEAVGHSFFTLSLGMGAIMTYGSYLEKKEDLIKTGFFIGVADTVIALMAGIVIFSIVFTYGMEPGSGPKLMFQTLPALFSKDVSGSYIAISFFGLVLFAALTSSVSLLQVVVSYFEETSKLSRKTLISLISLSIFSLGILSALSTNVLADFYVIEGNTFFDTFDKLSSHYLLPIGGFLMAIFFGWKVDPNHIKEIFQKHPKTRFYFFVLLWSNRILAPMAIFIMILNSVLG